MDDLVQWLSAQVGEDERIARAATPGPWAQARKRVEWVSSAEHWAVADCSGAESARENAEHVAAWDPARALVESAIKRRVMDEYDACAAWAQMPDAAEAFRYRAEAYREVLKNFAELYADRPGYREEWRP